MPDTPIPTFLTATKTRGNGFWRDRMRLNKYSIPKLTMDMVSIARFYLTHPCRVPPLYRLLTFDHNYANNRPILLVQRPISFYLVSLERICNVPWCHSNHCRRCRGCYFSSIEVGGVSASSFVRKNR